MSRYQGDAEPSPAERYRAAAERRSTELGRFRAGLDFELDSFQVEACRELERGRGVLVAAPTGAGKTVVGEFAVHLALAGGRKVFYTTPIKALSNQKYADLARSHGHRNVGLLTGDISINGDAPIVVMTTEVLRNMLYAESDTLAGLGYVVMDEVHYLADRMRGAVWEEVILHLAADVRVVSLSATVSNAEEFGDWLAEVRGDTAVVVSEHRPVPLWQHVMVRTELFDLYSSRVDPTRPGRNPPINPRLAEALRRLAPRPGGAGRGGRGARGRDAGHRVGARPASRAAVVERLDRTGLLPAIVFIFSRAGCEAAVQQVVNAGVRLTTPAEQERIRAVVDERSADLAPQDLDVLGYWAWRHALMQGLAAHHAGMLPVFKETVEALFTAGLVKVVYATETLALGINMPARSVVLERLVKWDGRTHAEITAGEYTQLTGRAGRRGIDVDGHAVVLHSAGLEPTSLAGLASRRTYPLRSSFRPTYNMAVNLVARSGHARSREVLETSFAQFQADRAVVGLARTAREQEEALAGYDAASACHLGDFREYVDLRRAIKSRERALSRERGQSARSAAAEWMRQARPGDVVAVPAGRRAGYAVVLESAAHLGAPRLTVLGEDRRVRQLSVDDVRAGLETVTQIRIPRGFVRNRPADRRDLAATLRNALTNCAPPPNRPRPKRERAAAAEDAELARLRAQLRAHPCHGCADREDHARWAERWHRLSADHSELLGRIRSRTSSIARDFDRICDVLTELATSLAAASTSSRPRAVPGCAGSTPNATSSSPSACGAASGTTWSRRSSRAPVPRSFSRGGARSPRPSPTFRGAPRPTWLRPLRPPWLSRTTWRP